MNFPLDPSRSFPALAHSRKKVWIIASSSLLSYPPISPALPLPSPAMAAPYYDWWIPFITIFIAHQLNSYKSRTDWGQTASEY
eukprot:190659-Hanusia_phi.AAC.1